MEKKLSQGSRIAVVQDNERIVGLFSFPNMDYLRGLATFYIFHVDEGVEGTIGMKMLEVMCDLVRAAGAVRLAIPASIKAGDEAMLSLWRSKNPDLNLWQDVMVKVEEEEDDEDEEAVSFSVHSPTSLRKQQRTKERKDRRQKYRWVTENLPELLEVSGIQMTLSEQCID